MPVLVKKLFIWVGTLLLIFFMAFRPESAATIVRSVGAVLMAVAQGIGNFFSRLFM